MSKKATNFRTWMTWQLRRISYLWPPRQQAFRDAQVSWNDFKRRPGISPAKITRRIRNFYRCALCQKVFPRKLVSADHIMPVVNPKKGWQGWDEYIERLFCPVDGFQIICKDDHDEKTASERKVRQRYKEAA